MKKVITTGILFAMLLGSSVSASSVTRLYNPADGNHWFTTDANKVAGLVAQGWVEEGTAFESVGMELPAYVVTSPKGYFHFTSNIDEIIGLVNKGWTLGEQVFYTASSGLPVYRVYNPNAGVHHFTSDSSEIDYLTSLGWRNEGVAYYVMTTAKTSDLKTVGDNYFIDVSSHNGYISVEDFLKLNEQGITGVTIKLTEGTSYINPYAASQITNALAANMRISAYHYSHYTSAEGAKEEARYFVQAAQKFGLGPETLMVGDIEEDLMVANINNNMLSWQAELRKLGFSNQLFYTGQRWLDVNGGPISVSQFGVENFWIAHYPKGYEVMSQEEAADYGYYSSYAAWQYTSSSKKLARPLDESIDYTGRFTK